MIPEDAVWGYGEDGTTPVYRPETSSPTDREWVVERAWRVRARTAQQAIEKAEPGAHDFIRVYEGTEPRPWEAT